MQTVLYCMEKFDIIDAKLVLDKNNIRDAIAFYLEHHDMCLSSDLVFEGDTISVYVKHKRRGIFNFPQSV